MSNVPMDEPFQGSSQVNLALSSGDSGASERAEYGPVCVSSKSPAGDHCVGRVRLHRRLRRADACGQYNDSFTLPNTDSSKPSSYPGQSSGTKTNNVGQVLFYLRQRTSRTPPKKSCRAHDQPDWAISVSVESVQSPHDYKNPLEAGSRTGQCHWHDRQRTSCSKVPDAEVPVADTQQFWRRSKNLTTQPCGQPRALPGNAISAGPD